MILITILTVLLSFSWFIGLPEILTKYAQGFHYFCLLSLPNTVENLSSLETLVCGKNMQDPALQLLLTQSSLIHIFIVSGSHFIFLHKILARLMGKSLLAFIPLGLYAMITLCQPPSVRSLLFLMLIEISNRKKLFLSPLILVFISTLLSVAIFPQWIYSRSFLMSVLAALSMAMASEFLNHKKNHLEKLFLTQCFLYLVMGFCLWGFSALHPLTILLNVTLGPLIGGLLFPLGLFVVVCPWLGGVFDVLLNSLFWILQKTQELLQAESLATPLGILWQWLFFWGLLLISYHVAVAHRRSAYEA
jgi:predicted membrane metal-binding protein